ncbi:ABC transporter substrate-binding protein (plasmid) [Paracoccus denitrificans]|uniref:substrate-binding domain-containing protein n=1 Tax=Paracoccus denitrificans TaxID=266 RepID=UPI001E2BB1F6|nr:substrate-binding domain-containing protein [Paracoccus denitrificans]UFS68213.1 ABC transporter substrate-binding protein [Paracoccus denitrificans]
MMKKLHISIAALVFAAPAMAQEFNLETLAEAAKSEPPVSVYDSTGKIVAMAENFATKYGIEAAGTKARASEQLEMVIREAQAGSIKTSVVLITDVPAAMAQLVPEGFVESWLPPDLAGDIDAAHQNPLLMVSSPNLFAYNTALSASCPISNIWQLTEPEWRGHLAMEDPLRMPIYTDWFNQMRSHADEAVAAAYRARYGTDLQTEFGSATEALVAALAANAPLITDTDTAAAEATAAPGAKDPFISIISAAKFRDNALKGYTLGICGGMEPFAGFFNATAALIVKNNPSPNASKLFVHYVMTGEGIAPQVEDGKVSSNRTVHLREDEPSGVAEYLDDLLPFNATSAVEDWDSRQDWQDFWRLNYVR